MKNYWLTTHWPHREGNSKEVHSNIYLPDGREGAGRDLRPGDQVLIYESRHGRTLERLTYTGEYQHERVKCKTGRMGIVTVGKVNGLLQERENTPPENYVDGTSIWWRWLAKTDGHNTNGFVPLADVNRVLGYEAGNTLRGFGDEHSGLKKLTKGEFDELLALFLKKPVVSPIAPDGELPPPGRRFEGGGESDAHRDLKEYVATHPDILGEDGLTTHRVEFPFVTGDRADIVLFDKIGRVIGVEIEICQDANDHDGILQAIKYRHMLAFMFGLHFEESRSMLIAYELSAPTRQLCERYNVEAYEISRELVNHWISSRPKN